MTPDRSFWISAMGDRCRDTLKIKKSILCEAEVEGTREAEKFIQEMLEDDDETENDHSRLDGRSHRYIDRLRNT